MKSSRHSQSSLYSNCSDCQRFPDLSRAIEHFVLVLVCKDVPLVRQKNVLEWIYDLLLHTILPGTNPSGQVFALIDLTPLLYQLVPLCASPIFFLASVV